MNFMNISSPLSDLSINNLNVGLTLKVIYTAQTSPCGHVVWHLVFPQLLAIVPLSQFLIHCNMFV